MKTILPALAALFLFAAGLPEAGAVTCANGVYRAGCAGPNGAAAVRKPAAPPPRAVVVAPPRGAVVVPAPACRWVDGVRVCR